MNTIPATEAKAQFSDLLDRVDAGEEFVVTRHGRDAAYLGPAQRPTKGNAAEAVSGLLALRAALAARGPVIKRGETIKGLIAKGRC